MPVSNPDWLADDPWFKFSYGTGPNISTLRITYPNAPFEWTIIQDYRTKSVIGGFAQVGGLGSILSIGFVILFGNSLLGIMYCKSVSCGCILACLFAHEGAAQLHNSRLEITDPIRHPSQSAILESKTLGIDGGEVPQSSIGLTVARSQPRSLEIHV
jgi:hypothetical protein